VYGPFKRLYNREIDAWLVSHPGKTVSIYDIAEVSGKAWSKAAMPANIISGFAASGIHPFQPDVWHDEHFCFAQVTDRPNPQQVQSSQSQLSDHSSAIDVPTVQGEVTLPPAAECLSANLGVTADIQGECASTPTETPLSICTPPMAPVQETVSDSPVSVTSLSIRSLPVAPSQRMSQKTGINCPHQHSSERISASTAK